MGKISNIRNQIKTVLSTITGLTADRIKLGYIVFDESGADFLNDLAKKGLFVAIHNGHISNYEIGKYLGDIELDIKLYMGFDKNADNDFIDVEDVIEKMIHALSLQSNFLGIANTLKSLSVQPSLLSTDNEVITKSYVFSLVYYTSLEQS